VISKLFNAIWAVGANAVTMQPPHHPTDANHRKWWKSGDHYRLLFLSPPEDRDRVPFSPACPKYYYAFSDIPTVIETQTLDPDTMYITGFSFN